jgi:hypothetical protein
MNNAMGYAAGNAEPRPTTVLESARESMARGIEELSSAIEGLANAAASVLRPEGPPPPQSTAEAQKLASIQPEHCEVVKDLHGLRQRVEQLVNRVNQLRNRLEV